MSKFSGVLKAARGNDNGESKTDSPTDTTNLKTSKTAPQETDTATRGRGRPAEGKRSDPDFVQTTAYIRKDTHRDVKIALIKEGQGREYSELVEQLLRNWLEIQ